jgi:predicted nucleotidyltransferase
MDALTQAARATQGLAVLMLFGSRARCDAYPGSDWDLGYLATDALDVDAWLGTLVELVGSDRVDLVDLRRASGLLRYRAARDGRLVYEARPGLGERFCLEAAQFWCDAAPVLQRGYNEVLADLKP